MENEIFVRDQTRASMRLSLVINRERAAFFATRVSLLEKSTLNKRKLLRCDSVSQVSIFIKFPEKGKTDNRISR